MRLQLDEPKFGHCTVNTPETVQLTAGGQGFKKSEVIDLMTMEHKFQYLNHKRYSHACTTFTNDDGTYIGLLAGKMVKYNYRWRVRSFVPRDKCATY